MGWRRHTFEEGRQYRVLADCDVQLDKLYHFQAGEVLVFCRDYYSHYDNVSVYLFQAPSGEQRYWALHDAESDDRWGRVFERVDESPAS